MSKDIQIGGQHYKEQAIQPIEYIEANNLGYHEGNIVKYVTRYKLKGGIQDLEKAKHYIELLIAHTESQKQPYTPTFSNWTETTTKL